MVTRLTYLTFLSIISMSIMAEERLPLTLLYNSIPVGGAVEILGELVSPISRKSLNKIHVIINERDLGDVSDYVHVAPSTKEGEPGSIYISLWHDPNSGEPLFGHNGNYSISVYSLDENSAGFMPLKTNVMVAGKDIGASKAAAYYGYLATGRLEDRILAPISDINDDNPFANLILLHDKVHDFFQASRSDNPSGELRLETMVDDMLKLYDQCEERLMYMGLMRHRMAYLVARCAARCKKFIVARQILASIFIDKKFPYYKNGEDLITLIEEAEGKQ